MIDFVKIIVKDLVSADLENNGYFEFVENINLSTSELKTVNRDGVKIAHRKIGYYNGLEFIIFDNGRITVSGSLHKYWNKGAHNYNDFNLTAVLAVLNDLKVKFGIMPQKSILKQLEVGINFLPPKPTNKILDYCFLHKTKRFEYVKNSDEGRYIQCEHRQYIIKIYNKALHYRSKGFEIDGEIMRFEIKYTKMAKLNKEGIYTMQDLIDYGLHDFKMKLVDEWESVLFFDKTIRTQDLGTKLKNRVKDYSNPVWWTELKYCNFKDHREQLKNITERYSENIQKSISEIISQKVDFLNHKNPQIDHLYILSKQGFLGSEKTPENKTSKDRFCKVTGLNISMQKDDSVLLSHTGLEYYYQTDRKIFEQIKRRYLSRRWILSDYGTQIKEIAHNIRNADSNSRIKQNRLYSSGQINLLNALMIN